MLSEHLKENCPHVNSKNLIPIKKFKSLPFADLKCKNCKEKSNLLICLFCGGTYCSRKIKSHFINHLKSNPKHCLCLGIVDLSVWCYECIDVKNNNKSKKNKKGCYIKSKITDEYSKICGDNFKFSEKKDEKVEEKGNKSNTSFDENLIQVNKAGLCEHINNITEEEWRESKFIDGVKDYIKKKEEIVYDIFCFSCNLTFNTYDKLNSHFTSTNHNFYLNLNDLSMICMKCKLKSGLIILKNKLTTEQKSSIQELIENKPIHPTFLSNEEIFELKYKKFINEFISGKFKNIIFMVGAGISTSAGIPDFRSSTGLFQQLQDKYHLSGPEEFFYKSTFMEKPIYFYEFSKLFDLSQTQPTIGHKFMNFLINKNIVKYVFTQNIDGLETKAKIPEDKLIFAHGNFNYGHCAQCYKDIDIEKINEGIQKGNVYYCPDCNGPCKPKIVFYGEKLPDRFHNCVKDIKDIDLIIIMGTSLLVYPFAGIPEYANNTAGKVVFNMEEVGYFQYYKIAKNSLFIKGKIDENILKFLKDVKLYDEFEKFIKKEYNQELKDIIGEEKKLMNVNELGEEDSLSKLREKIKNMQINDMK